MICHFFLFLVRDFLISSGFLMRSHLCWFHRFDKLCFLEGHRYFYPVLRCRHKSALEVSSSFRQPIIHGTPELHEEKTFALPPQRDSSLRLCFQRTHGHSISVSVPSQHQERHKRHVSSSIAVVVTSSEDPVPAMQDSGDVGQVAGGKSHPSLLTSPSRV